VAPSAGIGATRIREDLRKTKTAMLSLSIGSGGVPIGGLLILLLAHQRHALAGLPLWACDGIVRDLLAISGAVFLVRKNTIARLDVVPRTRWK
jgi:hypothetical protein